jgi:hypothetical protein
MFGGSGRISAIMGSFSAAAVRPFEPLRSLLAAGLIRVFEMTDLRTLLFTALALGLSSLFWIAPAEAQTHHDSCGTPPCTIIQGVAPIYLYNSLGEQYISSATLASATNLTVPTGATIAEICVETAGVRYRERGLVPTASIGMPAIAPSSTLPYCFPYAGPLGTVEFIAISGSPTMDIFYYSAN